MKKGVLTSLRTTLDALLGTGKSCCDPNIVSIDKAITLLIDSIDWEGVMRGARTEVGSIASPYSFAS